MKKILLVALFVVMFISCSQNKHEKAISDYEQTIGNTKIDLKFKSIDIKEVRLITVADSLDMILKDTNLTKAEALSKLNRVTDKYLEDSVRRLNEYSKDKEFRDRYNRYSRIEVENAQKEYDYQIGLEEYIKKQFESRDMGEHLRTLVECRYSIENPILNNTKQEIINTYIKELISQSL